MAPKQSTTAYEKLIQEENRIANEIALLNHELSQLRDQEAEQQVKIDRAVLAGKTNTHVLEHELEQIQVDRRRKENRFRVLNTAHESDIFLGHAKEAIDELGVDLQVLQSDWQDLKTQLENAFDIYLRAVGKFKELERRDIDLRQKVSHAQSFLPRGSGLTYVEGVPERTTTNLQNPKGVDGLKGIVWMCARRDALMRIRDVYEKPQG